MEKAKEILSCFSKEDKFFDEANSLLKLLDFYAEAAKENVNGEKEKLYHQACIFASKGEYSKALDTFLLLIEKDMTWKSGLARNSMNILFGVLGPKSELTWKYRSKLNRLLFV